MADLIDRQAAIDAIRKDMYADKDYMSGLICDGIEDVLNALPSAEYERKKGEWIPLGHRSGFLKHPNSFDWKCSCCGYELYTVLMMPSKTCPNCGADMRESVLKIERALI